MSDTPAYKIRITASGDKGTLYFECHYVDVKTQKVVSVVGRRPGRREDQRQMADHERRRGNTDAQPVSLH